MNIFCYNNYWLFKVDLNIDNTNFLLCFFVCFVFVFWLHCMACSILVPQPGIKPVPPALEAQSLNHWTTREVPNFLLW